VQNTDRWLLRAYMWVVVAAGVPPIVWVALQPGAAYLGYLSGRSGLIIALLCVVLILGELWPIPVARGREAGDEITVSSTFGFALLLVGPVFFSLAAQALALMIDFVLRGGRPSRLPFNISQYALAFIASRLAYALIAGQPIIPPINGPAPNLMAAMVAGGVFLLVNNVLVGIAVSLSLQIPIRQVLAGDIAWQIATSAPLLGLGPLTAQAMAWTPLSIVLVLVPIVALHHSGNMAMMREQEALRDTLTGLANRSMLTGATERALASTGTVTAMLLLDLDHFKEINDTLGHAVGDEMLVAIAARLSAEAGPNDLVARLGGDEFVVLNRNVPNVQSATAFAERLCAAMREPVSLHGVTLTVGCSVGIAFGPEHADTVSDLLRCADIALYAAKTTRDTSVVYDKQADRHSAALLGLQADLRSALEDEHDTQIWLAYQPQLDLTTGRIASVECLARWQHPELGNVAPDTFIPIAESTSLIDVLLRRVLNESLSQLAAWDRNGLSLMASVNLSSRQISDATLPETICEYLAAHGIAPNRLVLEVTESRLMTDPEHCAQILRRLHELGLQISIDDFGTGYSSLAYLQRLAVDELKIDKSFTMQLADTGDTTIVRSTIDLGHNLGLRVVAEGVEDQHTADRLADIGCDILQGYFLGHPMSAADLAAHISRTPQSLISRAAAEPAEHPRIFPRLELVAPRRYDAPVSGPLEKAE
jgi:diguanylate cyclase (GGDEF)-like protein